jgi:hypothetical protein
MTVSREKISTGENKEKHWMDDEINLLLDIVEEFLPRDQRDWAQVTTAYINWRGAYMSERDKE